MKTMPNSRFFETCDCFSIFTWSVKQYFLVDQQDRQRDVHCSHATQFLERFLVFLYISHIQVVADVVFKSHMLCQDHGSVRTLLKAGY